MSVFDGALRQLGRGLVMHADHFGGLRRIHGGQHVAGCDRFAADAQFVFASQFGADFTERQLHRAPVGGVGEIGIRFVAEFG